MQTAVTVKSDSVCPSVRPSVTFWCFVQTNEDMIVRFPASGRKIVLVSGEVKFIRIFAGGHTQRGRLNEAPRLASENLISNQP